MNLESNKNTAIASPKETKTNGINLLFYNAIIDMYLFLG